MEKKKKFKLFRFELKKNLAKYRFTLDYKEDFLIIKEIIINLYKKRKKITMENVVNFINKNKNIYLINKKRNLLS